MSLLDDLTTGLRAAPDLYQAPSLAVPVATQGGDVAGNAQATAHAVNAAGLQSAADQIGKHTGGSNFLFASLGNFFGGALREVKHDLGAAGGFALKALGAPLQEVQHQYRYLRDVAERHGPIAAMLEGLAMGGGAAVGTVLGGPAGGVLGAEAVGSFLGRTTFHDSWERTQEGEAYRDSSGHMVSPGRDLARVIDEITPGHMDKGALQTVTSAIGDGIFDLAFDPLQKVGAIAKEARGAEGARGLLRASYGGRLVETADDIDRVRQQYRGVERAFGEMAQMDAGTIVSRYEKFAALAPDLGRAQSADEVADVFGSYLLRKELSDPLMPTRSFLGLRMNGLRAAEALPEALTEEAIAANRPGTLSKVRRTLTTRVPTAFDPDLLKYSTKSFDAMSPEALRVVYKTARMGLDDDVARALTTQFAQSVSEAERTAIYRNVIVKSLIAKGLPIDAFTLGNVRSAVTDSVSTAVERAGLAAGKNEIYGLDAAGHAISPVLDSSGVSHSAGVLAFQRSAQLAIPDYKALNASLKEIQNHSRLFGRADDWLYERFTQGIFKRFVLLSGGFALRVSAAEAIPGALREGASNYLKGRIASSAAKLGKEVMEEESEHAVAAVSRLFGGMHKVIKMTGKIPGLRVSEADVDLAGRMILANDGHIVAPALDAAHVAFNEIGSQIAGKEINLYKTAKRSPIRYRVGDEFSSFGPGERNFTDHWQRSLADVAQDPASQQAAKAYSAALKTGAAETEATAAGMKAARDYWAAQPEEELAKHLRGRFSTDADMAPLDAWGKAIMENVKGAVWDPATDTAHAKLLEGIARGRAHSVQSLDRLVPETINRPLKIRGSLDVPYVNGALSHVANEGFRRVLNPMINFLSREPLYFAAVKRQYGYLGKALEAGLIDEEAALHLAQVRSVQDMLPHIHNIHERTQFAQLTRNWMPFYFAQEQAYRRAGRLLATDPAAFRQYQLSFTALKTFGERKVDEGGQPYLMYPGSGFLGRLVPQVLGHTPLGAIAGSVPVSFSGSLHSLATVSPLVEDIHANFGPVVAIPMKMLASWMPESEPLVSAVIGDQAVATPLWRQIIPNTTLQRTITAFWGEHDPAFQSSMVHTIQALAHEQEMHPDRKIVPPPDAGPLERQQFLDKVRNQTRIVFLMKAAIGSVAPASPKEQIGDIPLQDELRALMKEKGPGAAITEFLAKNPEATAYTVFQSEADVNAPLQATSNAQNFINAHMDTLKDYPFAGAWFIPQAPGEYDPAIYNEQLALALRHKKSPEQILKDIYVAEGNHQYFEVDRPAYEAALAGVRDDPSAVRALKADWSSYVQQYGMAHPVWWDHLQSPDREHERALAIDQLHQIFTDGKAPEGAMTGDIRGVLEDWDNYQAALPASGVRDPELRRALEEDWNLYLKGLVKAKPQLAAVVNRLFRTIREDTTPQPSAAIGS